MTLILYSDAKPLEQALKKRDSFPMNHVTATDECVGRGDRCCRIREIKIDPKYGRDVHDWFDDASTLSFLVRAINATDFFFLSLAVSKFHK